VVRKVEVDLGDMSTTSKEEYKKRLKNAEKRARAKGRAPRETSGKVRKGRKGRKVWKGRKGSRGGGALTQGWFGDRKAGDGLGTGRQGMVRGE
jgi:hypothetical protein